MATIYELHEKAFDRVSAFIVAKGGEKVATVALKFPADGAGRLYAYVYWLGLPMVRGCTGGFGYDKRGAAVSDAVAKIGPDDGSKINSQAFTKFYDALANCGGQDWTRTLESAGFVVWQAV